MQAPKAIISLSALALGLTIGHTAANAASFELLSNFTDDDFRAIINSGTFTEDYVAESRIGDGAGAATYELALKEPSVVKPIKDKGFNWENKKTYDFELKSENGKVTYKVGGTELSSFDLVDMSPNNTVYIRAFAGPENTKVKLTNITVDGNTYGGHFMANGDNNQREYLKVTDINGDFTITGQSIFAWSDTDRPRNSNVAYQFKVGNEESVSAETVPEPASALALLGVALAGVAFKKH